MKKENLLIVITTENAESIMKFPLLYSSVSLPREYWKRVHIIFWGPSIRELKSNGTIQSTVQNIKREGVEFSACIICAEDYDAVHYLENMGITCNHTGDLLTLALQDDSWSVLTV